MRTLIIFLLPIFMFAHSLSVTASYEDGELFIESFYGDGNPCKGCEFKITNGDKESFKGNLDDEGAFEEAIKLQAPFDVHVDGGMGHWADVNIEGNEMGEKPEVTESTNAMMSGIDESKIREIIKTELNKQNAKIQSMIEKNKSNTEKMLVGLGYILGIFGLWQLFAKRKEN
jgi:nickel transport protein